MPSTKKIKTLATSPTASFKYIVTPALYSVYSSFLYHSKIAEYEPIMIVGDSGVGKSLFLHVAKTLFEVENDKDEQEHPVSWINCAHFSGHDLARSELFGHSKGAFTGAIKEYAGAIESANNGLLILEEIGELPLEVQAMLLTFIETGQYQRIGDPKMRHANVKIIGATNREEALRKDFRYRFLPFYISPMYVRRGDVLYYLLYKFPDLIPTLTMREILALLAYNWPGNVREINRVGFLMRRFKLETAKVKMFSDESKYVLDSLRLSAMDKRNTMLNADALTELYDKVRDSGGDTKVLERLLNKYHLSLNLSLQKRHFDFKDVAIQSDQIKMEIPGDHKGLNERAFKESGIAILPRIKQFDEAIKGFKVFCELFGQDRMKNKNIITDLKNFEDINFYSFSSEYNSKSHKEKQDLMNLQKKIMEMILGTSNEEFFSIVDPFKYLKILKAQKEKSVELMVNPISEGAIGIWSLKEDELRKTYYEGLLERAKGNVRKASKMAGLKETTFRARMDSLAIRYKKGHKNPE